MMTKEELKAPMKKLIIVFPAMMALGIGIGIGFVANNSPKNKSSYELQQKCTKDAENFIINARAGKISGALFGSSPIETERVDMLQHHYSGAGVACGITPAIATISLAQSILVCRTASLSGANAMPASRRTASGR